MSVKTILGQYVAGNDFHNRTKEIAMIWENLKKGSNILISAPRRVGKTSIMNYLKDNPKENHQIYYITTESVDNENEFYKKLYKHIIDRLNVINKFKNQIIQLIKSKTVTSISIFEGNITFENVEKIYFDELIKLLKSLDLKEEKLIIMIDEFPQTIENIIKDEGENNAIHFLESNRELRQLPELRNKIQFIYTGSIGLENIVNRLNATSTIGDLTNIPVLPFTQKESEELIKIIIKNSDINLYNESISYILKRIDWLIPFHIHIIIDELYNIFKNENLKIIDNTVIDRAFTQALERRNYFEYWHTRLRKSFKQEDYKFIKETLNKISENNSLTSNEIYNIAISYKIEDCYKEIINELKYDGYINNSPDPKIYKFNSPILKLWWYQNVAN